MSAAAAADVPLILLLDYRSVIETVDLDAENFASWREVLDSFGYENLDDGTFVQDLALSSSAEVMMALCPYTTKNEWGPALNKRDTRLSAAVDEMCYVNVVPVPGALDLITAASRLRRAGVFVLSPFTPTVSETLLGKAGLDKLVDGVVCYESLDTAVLEAMSAAGRRPLTIPASAAAAASQLFPRGRALPPDFADADVVVFVSTSTAAKKCRGYGVTVVGVEHNNRDQEVDYDGDFPPMLPDRDSAADLLESGCRLVVPDFRSVTPQHIVLLNEARCTGGPQQ